MDQRCSKHVHACERTAPGDSLLTEMIRAAIQGIAFACATTASTGAKSRSKSRLA